MIVVISSILFVISSTCMGIVLSVLYYLAGLLIGGVPMMHIITSLNTESTYKLVFTYKSWFIANLGGALITSIIYLIIGQ